MEFRTQSPSDASTRYSSSGPISFSNISGWQVTYGCSDTSPMALENDMYLRTRNINKNTKSQQQTARKNQTQLVSTSAGNM